MIDKIKGRAKVLSLFDAELNVDFKTYQPCNWIIKKIKSKKRLSGKVEATVHVDKSGKGTITPLKT